MTPRQKRFAAEYLVDLNATQAAIRAGYSKRTAQEQASRLLSNVIVADAIAKAQAERSRRTEITADRVLCELAKLGLANMQDYVGATGAGDPFVDLSGLSREQWAAVQEVTVEDFVDGRGEDARDVRRVKFKLADKRAALVELGRHLGIFTDKVEHTGKDGAALELASPSKIALAILAVLRAPAAVGESRLLGDSTPLASE